MRDVWIPIVSAAIGTIPPTILALAALRASRDNGRKVEQLHVAVNSRLTQLLEQTQKASHAEGMAEGAKRQP